MSEMVERVAEAIFDVDQPAYAGRQGEMDQAMWEKYERHYTKCARAAIAAMREPTDHMIDVAAISEFGFDGETWSEMIDAALK